MPNAEMSMRSAESGARGSRKVRSSLLQIALIAAVLPLMTVPASAAAGPLGKRYELENGMVLLLSERHDIPMVTVQMAIRAGGLTEPAGRPGLASLTASLLTQGTKRRSANEISREIDFIGGSLGVSGGSDFATASLRVLKKDIGTGMDLLADVLRNPAFDQQEIDRKVKEMLAAIRRQKDEPDAVAKEAFTKAVFGGHPYGTVSDDEAAFLPAVTREDIRAFHAERYGPNTSIIAVVGDITEAEVRDLLQKHFGGWSPVERKEPAHPAPPPIEKLTVRKLDRDITQANIALGHLGIRREDPDFYAVSVMNFILGGGGFSSRLMDNIRDNRGLAYDVHSLFLAQKEPGAFRVWTQTKSGSANEAVSEIIAELRRIRTTPVSERELADAKAYLTGSFPLRMDTYAKIASMLTSIEIYGLGLDYPDRYAGMINAVTREDVLRVAKKHLHPDRMVIVVLGNQDAIRLGYGE